MSQKRQLFRYRGLQTEFVFSLIVSAFLCGMIFLMLYYSTDFLLTRYFNHSDFEYREIQKQGQNLQEFIDKNEISSKNLSLLEKWEQRQPVILFELYAEGKCIYSSFYDVIDSQNHGLFFESESVESGNQFNVKLSDTAAEAILYSDFTYQYYVLARAVSAIVSIILFVLVFLNHNRKLIRYICRLNDEVQILEGGDLDYQVSVEGNNEITDLAESMNRMRKSFKQQIDTEQQLQQKNNKLITEMSHDLRTPLTSIMLYLEILKTHRYSSERELQDYLNKIYLKTHQMKMISDHLFEYSKEKFNASHTGLLEMKQAFKNELANLEEDLNDQGYRINTELKWEPYYVQINAEYIHRIIGNIFTNILKYAEKNAAIQIYTVFEERYCGFSIMNVCKTANIDSESNEIGIESIQSMMQKMNGLCTVEQTDAAFEISLLFPKQ